MGAEGELLGSKAAKPNVRVRAGGVCVRVRATCKQAPMVSQCQACNNGKVHKIGVMCLTTPPAAKACVQGKLQ